MNQPDKTAEQQSKSIEHSSNATQTNNGTSSGFSRQRRAFLKSAAFAGVAAAGFAVPAGASGAVTPYDDEYGSVVDVAAEGADITGGDSISSLLYDLRADDTLLYFPAGRYFMDSQFRYSGFENFGVYGDDATLVPADYEVFGGDSRARLFLLGTTSNPGKRVRFENFHVDFTAPDTGVRVIDAAADDRLDVRNIRIHGQHDSGAAGPGHFNVTSPSGTGIVDRFRAPDGGKFADNTPHEGNRWVGPIGILANDTTGTLTFRRCWLHGFPSNGLYCSGGSGRIVVRGGWFKNNNVASLRVGGNNSEIRYPTIQVDNTRPMDQAQRGIRLEGGSNAHVRGAQIKITSPLPTSHAISVMNSMGSATIEKTTIEMSGDNTNHGIVVSPKAGETLVQYTDIAHNTAGGYPVWVRDSSSDDRVHLRHISITGEAGDGAGFRDAIRCARDNFRISRSEIDQSARSGSGRMGLVTTSSDTTVYKVSIRADRYPYEDLGTDNWVHSAEFESHRSSHGAVRLYSSTKNAELYSSRLVNGIVDQGSSGTKTWNNTYE